MAENESKANDSVNVPVGKYLDKIRKNPWIVSTTVLAIAIIVLVIISSTGGLTGNVISENDAGARLVEFINAQGGDQATLVSTVEESGMYKVIVNYQSQDIPVYVTLDGKYLITSTIPLATAAPAAGTDSTATTEVPKTDKPKVELFVMSFCPYGVRAENNIFPILDLLKDKIDFKIRFIVNVGGDTLSSVQSLHGAVEAKEDARQVIIMKYYPDKFLAYLKQFNNDCYQYLQDEANLGTCWKNAAAKNGIDANKVDSLSTTKEAIDLLKADEALGTTYGGISGSPTLVINGVQSKAIYSGTSATQTAICGAFNSAPTECSQTVQAASTTSQPSGSCG